MQQQVHGTSTAAETGRKEKGGKRWASSWAGARATNPSTRDEARWAWYYTLPFDQEGGTIAGVSLRGTDEVAEERQMRLFLLGTLICVIMFISLPTMFSNEKLSARLLSPINQSIKLRPYGISRLPSDLGPDDPKPVSRFSMSTKGRLLLLRETTPHVCCLHHTPLLCFLFLSQ